jgi:hypothetical protein
MEIAGFGREIASRRAGIEVKGLNTERTENGETRVHGDAPAGRGLYLRPDVNPKQIPAYGRQASLRPA